MGRKSRQKMTALDFKGRIKRAEERRRKEQKEKARRRELMLKFLLRVP